jgi:hypothetical protein
MSLRRLIAPWGDNSTASTRGAHLPGAGGQRGHPGGAAGLEFMAGNYRTEILDIGSGNAFANTVPTQRLFGRGRLWPKLLILLGERAGARTQDPVIKSYVLRSSVRA